MLLSMIYVGLKYNYKVLFYFYYFINTDYCFVLVENTSTNKQKYPHKSIYIYMIIRRYWLQKCNQCALEGRWKFLF